MADTDIRHFIVRPAGYNAVVRLLGSLPYAQVAPTMRTLEASTEVVTEAEAKLVRELADPERRLADILDELEAVTTAWYADEASVGERLQGLCRLARGENEPDRESDLNSADPQSVANTTEE